MAILLGRFCLLLCCLAATNGANILYLAGIPSPSHGIWNYKLAESLADRGHNITIISADKPKTPIKNTHVLYMEEIYEKFYETEDMNQFMKNSIFEEVTMMYGFMNKLCGFFKKADGFNTLLNYPDNFKFDLVINDFTIHGCLVGFLHKFNYPPLINVSPYKYTTPHAEMFGGHQYAGYIPRPGLPYSVDMNLMQRLENVAATVFELFYRRYVFQPSFDKLMVSLFEDENMPSSFELTQRAALTLLNTHPATDFPVPLPPSVIEVGGLQIADPKPLPEELNNFLETSKKGAVLICFGTNVRSEVFGDEKQKIIIEVAKKFPDYHFLWKFENDPSQGKVPNLLVKTWLPQNDILAHPKIKAFVSHGGGLSTHEASWHGIPVVAVPFFMDQHSNAKSLFSAGVASLVDVENMSTSTLEAAIRVVLEEESYANRMKLLSFRFKNRPMKPVNTAIWWIEYILKDPSASHLRSPVIDLGTFKSNCCDIILYGIVILVVMLMLICKLCNFICKCLGFSKSKKKVKVN